MTETVAVPGQILEAGFTTAEGTHGFDCKKCAQRGTKVSDGSHAEGTAVET